MIASIAAAYARYRDLGERAHVGADWETLSIPRGGSEEFTRRMRERG